MKKCVTSLITREIQIQPWDITSHLLGRALSKWKLTDAGKGVRNWNPCTLWHERKMEQPLWKTAWSFLKKIKNRITTWLINSTLGNVFKRIEIRILNVHLKDVHFYIHFRIIYNCQEMETIQMFIDRWMDREYDVYTQWNPIQL
jgi:hypothetical protein